jgi:hypothetical protein
MSETPSRDGRLNQVLAAYREAVEAGHTPDRAELLARHPDLADELAAFFTNPDRLSQLATPLRDAAPATDADATLPPPPADRRGRQQGVHRHPRRPLLAR